MNRVMLGFLSLSQPTMLDIIYSTHSFFLISNLTLSVVKADKIIDARHLPIVHIVPIFLIDSWLPVFVEINI